jgi:hypothetical protein
LRSTRLRGTRLGNVKLMSMRLRRVMLRRRIVSTMAMKLRTWWNGFGFGWEGGCWKVIVFQMEQSSG